SMNSPHWPSRLSAASKTVCGAPMDRVDHLRPSCESKFTELPAKSRAWRGCQAARGGDDGGGKVRLTMPAGCLHGGAPGVSRRRATELRAARPFRETSESQPGTVTRAGARLRRAVVVTRKADK